MGMPRVRLGEMRPRRAAYAGALATARALARRFITGGSHLCVPRIPQAAGVLADAVEAEHGEEHEQPRYQRDERVLLERRAVTLGDHVAPGRQRLLEPEPEEGQ